MQRTASALFLVTRTVADGLRLWLTGLLLQQFTGWDMATAILVFGVVTLVYTYLGGMEAVIWTDLIQFVIYLSGALLAGWFILRAIARRLERVRRRRRRRPGQVQAASIGRTRFTRLRPSGPASSAGRS